MLLKIFENLTTYMMIGIVIIVVVAQLSRFLGSLLGILFWIAVGVVGTAGYQAGHALGFPGLKLTLTQFLLLCGFFAAVQGFGIYAAVRRQRNREAYRRALEDDSD